MTFRGQYDCTMDDKGRIKMPAALRKQFPAEDGSRFMLVKDLEDCLAIYPMKAWEKQEARMAKLNPYNLKHQQFINALTAGLTEIEMDGNDRFLISKSLMRYLGMGKDMVLKGKGDKVQVWNAEKFEQYTQVNISNIQDLAEEAANHLDSLNDEE